MSDRATPCPLDHVNGEFHASRPNVLWVSDFTYVATWTGFVYVAFVIDAYARRIVGWRMSRSAHASFVLDARSRLSMTGNPSPRGGLVHHSDRGSSTSRSSTPSVSRRQVSSRRSAASATVTTMPSRKRSMASTRPRSSIAAVMADHGSRRIRNARMGRLVQNRRLLEPIGNRLPVEAEERYDARVAETAVAT